MSRAHCPVVEAYTRAGARQLFGRFSDVTIQTCYPFTYGFRFVVGWAPESIQRALGHLIGWHLMIRARRPHD